MKLNHRSKAVAHVFECAFLSIQTGHASYLGNVFGFEKVIDIEEHFDGYAKLKEVVDNSLDAVGRLHLVGGEGPLLLAQRGGAALEDDLLDNPEMGEFYFHVIDTCCDVLSMILLQLWLDPNLTSLSCPSGRFTTRC